MAASDGRQALAREVQRALSASGLSVAAACRKWNVDPKRLYRWLKAEVSPQIDDVEAFAQVIGEPIHIVVGPQTEETAPPEWVERLLTGVMALEVDASISDAALAQAQARAAAHLAVARRRRRRRVGAGGQAGSSS